MTLTIVAWSMPTARYCRTSKLSPKTHRDLVRAARAANESSLVTRIHVVIGTVRSNTKSTRSRKVIRDPRTCFDGRSLGTEHRRCCRSGTIRLLHSLGQTYIVGIEEIVEDFETAR